MFQQEHVPECDNLEDLPDIFNDTGSVADPASEDEEEPEEPLF